MSTKADGGAVLDDVFVSVVAVLDRGIADPAQAIRELHATLVSSYSNYEVVLVDNGVSNETLITVRALLEELSCIRVLRLSRQASHNTALFAGLDAAIGDVVISFGLESDPVELIGRMVNEIRGGADVVQGLSELPFRESAVGSAVRRLFYWYNRRFLGLEIPANSTFTVALSRRAVNAATTNSRNQRFVRHFIHHIGFRIVDLPFTPKRAPFRSRSRRAAISEALEIVTSYSTQPLRAVTILAAIAAAANLIYIGYIVLANLFLAKVAEGWTTTSLQLSIMFVCISAILAVQAEYIGRLLVETRREPAYYVMEELESDVLVADVERRNVSR